MTLPKKIVKFNERERMNSVIFELTEDWYSIEEISNDTWFHRVVISWILNRGKDYPISLEKLKILDEKIKEKYNK